MTIKRSIVVFLFCFVLVVWMGCENPSTTKEDIALSSSTESSVDEEATTSMSSSAMSSSTESSAVPSKDILSSSDSRPTIESGSSEEALSESILSSSSEHASIGLSFSALSSSVLSSSTVESSSESAQSSIASSSSKNYRGKYKTDFVFIGVVDGVRWSEGWGESTQQFMPRMRDYMAAEGVINTHFKNGGQTYTVPSHAAMITGVYEGLENDGSDVPSYASILHYYLKENGKHNTKAMVLSPKDKLEVLTQTDQEGWDDAFTPYQFTGVDGEGLGHGYWRDENFFPLAQELIHKYHPEIVLMNLHRPDKTGHGTSYDFGDYEEAIVLDDELYYQLWQYIQSDSIYKDRTTLFITNDHGRHIDDWKNHGHEGCEKGGICDIDFKNCDGCDHIFLYAFGPDFKKGVTVTTPRSLINLAPTVEELLEFDSPHSTGEVMVELFKDTAVVP